MSEIGTVINQLPNKISFTPATDAEINLIQVELAMPLAEEYQEYLREFGSVIAQGVELTGVSKAPERDVIQVTKAEKELNPQVGSGLYVVESLGIDGIVIWQDKDGNIFESTPKHPAKQIAKSLAEYLKENKFN